MDIRTKIVSTLIAMVCSMSVSATGVVVILLDYPVSTQTSFITMADVEGDLYGERYGAGNEDLIAQHLYVSGVGLDIDTLNYFTENVSFSKYSTEMTFIFKFILKEDATSGVKISFDSATHTNTLDFITKYNYAYGKERPDWEQSSEFIVGDFCVVDDDNSYIWLRMLLTVKTTEYTHLIEPCTWSFSITFSGVKE